MLAGPMASAGALSNSAAAPTNRIPLNMSASMSPGMTICAAAAFAIVMGHGWMIASDTDCRNEDYAGNNSCTIAVLILGATDVQENSLSVCRCDFLVRRRIIASAAATAKEGSGAVRDVFFHGKELLPAGR